MVYSDYHHDHIGGAGALAPGATIVAHAATAAELERAGDPERPVPTLTFDEAYTLTVGSQVLELGYYGPNHVDGNISVLAPQQQVLMMVDVVWPGWVPFVELGQAEYVPGYVDAFDEILALDFEVFVGGHVGRYGSRQDVEDVRAYVYAVRDNAGAALGAVSSEPSATTDRPPSWPVRALRDGETACSLLDHPLRDADSVAPWPVRALRDGETACSLLDHPLRSADRVPSWHARAIRNGETATRARAGPRAAASLCPALSRAASPRTAAPHRAGWSRRSPSAAAPRSSR